MTTPAFKFPNMAASRYMSPHKTFDFSQYPDETQEDRGRRLSSTVFGSTAPT